MKFTIVSACLSKETEKQKFLLSIRKLNLESVLKRFGMFDCTPVSTPMEAGKRFEKLADGEDAVNIKGVLGCNWMSSIWIYCHEA